MDIRRPITVARALALLAFLFPILFVTAPAALAAKGDCGQPSSSGSSPKAGDALAALKAAVGATACDLCVCDVNNDAKVTSSDALRILRKAVGQSVALSCPACVPKLTGIVRMPTATVQSINSAAVVVGLTGLVPAPGATVDLLHLDADGTPQLPAVATTTTNADGGYQFQPAPTPSSTTVVRATLGGQHERAFVTGNAIDVDPASEFVFDAAVEAFDAEPGADLGDLAVSEAEALVGLVRQADVDLSAAASVQAALDAIDAATGDVYRAYVGDFATDTGATPAMTGAFHLLDLGLSFARSFVPSTPSVASVNTRSLHSFTTADPLTVDAEGAVTQAATTGRSHTLVEVSGTSQTTGAINASATLQHANVAQNPGAATGALLAADDGRLLASAQGMVTAGLYGAGGSFGLLPAANRTSANAGLGALGLLLRQGSGLTNSSLSGTYWVVQFEFGLDVGGSPEVVHRSFGAVAVTNTMTFDGAGNLDLAAATGRSVQMSKENPLPAAAAADTQVVVSEAEAAEDAVDGLTYTLSATGALTVKAGSEVVAKGAVTPNRHLVVLTIGDDSSGGSASGLVIAIQRGSGMNNSFASGNYLSTDVGAFLDHDEQPGVVDTTPSFNSRSTSFSASVGSLQMNGAGMVSVHKAVGRWVGLHEFSGVQERSSLPDIVLDADTSIGAQTEGEGDGTETHSYSVTSNGKVTVDGQLTGFLSPDGAVFVLPIGESEETGADSGVLIALRQP